MSGLVNTPSGGQSEVLETLHFQGAISSGVPLFRLGPMVSARWHGDEDREGSDSGFEADVVTILAALQAAGYVVGHADLTGNVVDLSSGTPPPTTRIVLTPAGRAYARHPRPRPVNVH